MSALLDQLIHLAVRDLGTIRMIAPHVRRVSDPDRREAYIARVAATVNLPVGTIRDAVQGEGAAA